MEWLWSLRCKGKGGILADDMGLGKTMQICGLFAGLFNSGLIRRAVVLASGTLLPFWDEELRGVGLDGKFRKYTGTTKQRQNILQSIFQGDGILLITYETARVNATTLRRGEGSEDKITWEYMIADEGHVLKNPDTKISKCLLEIPSPHRIIISGTPIQNNLKELWAVCEFYCPNLLGNKDSFKEKFESKILLGRDKDAHTSDKCIGSVDVEILKQICDHPDLVDLKESRVADVSKGEQDILSCKVHFINSLLDKSISEGHRVLIFSQSCKMLDIIQINFDFIA